MRKYSSDLVGLSSGYWSELALEMKNDEMEKIKCEREIEELEKSVLLRAKRLKSIEEVMEEVEVLIDTHFFNEFYGTKSALFLKRVLGNQGLIEMRLFKRTWRSSNCTRRR